MPNPDLQKHCPKCGWTTNEYGDACFDKDACAKRAKDMIDFTAMLKPAVPLSQVGDERPEINSIVDILNRHDSNTTERAYGQLFALIAEVERLRGPNDR